MNYALMLSCVAALVLFVVVRPQWRRIGPSLLDSFVIGLLLFAVGSVLVWIEGLANSEAVMRIGISVTISGVFGASLWSLFFASRIAGLNFFADAKQLQADPVGHFVISAGFVVCSLVSVILLIAVFSHDHIRSLLFSAFLQNSDALNDVKNILASGSEGYFAPGYVKQFRDIIVPILCVAAILCDGTYRNRGLLLAALLIALAATFVSGQRLVIIQYILCLGVAVVIDQASPRRHYASLWGGLVLLLVLLGTVGAMTKLLGRLDAPLSSLPDPPKVQQQNPAAQAASKLDLQRMSTASEKATAAEAPGSKGDPLPAKKQLDETKAEGAGSRQTAPSIKPSGESPVGLQGILFSQNIPAVVSIPLSLVYRAIIAVPRENTLSYPLWTAKRPGSGSGWLTDLRGIRPGTQMQLSNELSGFDKSGHMGNSPLGLATDVFYNWGWFGVIIVPPLFALAFLWLDIGLVAGRSALTAAAKIFLFFSIPTMYSPFMFILYGGFVAIGTLCYAWLQNRVSFSFLEMRLQARKSPH